MKKIYIVGIEGAGTSALAQIYKSLGYDVSGSDNGDHFYWNILKNTGIKVFNDFKKENIPLDIDFAIHSTAFGDDNVEIAELKKRKINIYSYPEALGKIFNEKKGISVCGTHGKTTTTALLAQTIKDYGIEPMALVGSNVIDWDSNILIGKGEYFIIESDEYQNKLKYYNPRNVILTSVDWDHPDFFPDFEIYKNTFKDFVVKIPADGILVACGDSTSVKEVIKSANCNVFTYGFNEENDYVIKNNKFIKNKNESFNFFDLYYKNKLIGTYKTKLFGKHNILNSSSVIALCHKMNFDLKNIFNSIEKFKGTSRRFEYVGKYKEVDLIDDYAHHPEEIKTTLSGARDAFFDKKILTIFNPHTFTRTKALFDDFANSFNDSDFVIIIDIYGSAREKQGGISSLDLVNLINKYYPQKAKYIANMDDVIKFIKENYKNFDIIISMGAGDVWRITHNLKQQK